MNKDTEHVVGCTDTDINVLLTCTNLDLSAQRAVLLKAQDDSYSPVHSLSASPA